jgi:hypothetical protein
MEATVIGFGGETGFTPEVLPLLLAPPLAGEEPPVGAEPDGVEVVAAGTHAALLPKESPAIKQGVVSLLISILAPGGWLTEIVALGEVAA